MKICSKCNIPKDEKMGFSFRNDTNKYHNTCKECKNNITKNWTSNNINYVKDRRKQYYLDNSEQIKDKAKNWRKINPEKAKIQDKKKYESRCPVVEKFRLSQWKKRNKNKVNAWTAKYRTSKEQSVLFNLYKNDIYKFYDNCPQGFEVDHIIPITSKIVSGLHVPWNLQYLPIKENRIKSNKFDGTYSNESWRK